MTIEAIVAVSVGLTSRSGAALAFGPDSIIEIATAGILVWRLRAEFGGQTSPERIEEIERKAGRIVGGALFALASYVVLQSAAALLLHVEPERSDLGIALAVVAMVG